MLAGEWQPEICFGRLLVDPLSVGCGIGGPARTLAAEFGCRVTGLDLTEEYCRAAEMLTTLVGLGEEVTARQGSALDMPFDDETFDTVWVQNVSMNIEDKERLYSEIHRVLRPNGLLALQEVMAGPVPDLHFPVPWAAGPAISFLSTPDDARRLLAATGLEEVAWNDLTEKSIRFARELQVATANEPPTPLGQALIAGADFPRMIANQLRNMEEGRDVVIQALFTRT